MPGEGTGTQITYPAIVTAMVNVALTRIGANNISSITDGSPSAIKANIVWETVRDEVLQARDWRFAKLRASLTQNEIAPLHSYDYAYPLPSDFLRLVKPRGPEFAFSNPAANRQGATYPLFAPEGSIINTEFDPPVYPPGFHYIVEMVPGDPDADPEPIPDRFCLLTNYDNSNEDLFITYIRKVTDETLYTPTYKSCVIYRLAQDLAIAITESPKKANDMEALYLKKLYSAEAVNESLDHIVNETGTTSWINAGR